mmetsp:Transcript_128873/g.412712  ORF Transcript_128873/g.412712 Transcript_128873/m.412712 type:complete len:428 (-) Transcript_128873:641-1924(-)
MVAETPLEKPAHASGPLPVLRHPEGRRARIAKGRLERHTVCHHRSQWRGHQHVFGSGAFGGVPIVLLVPAALPVPAAAPALAFPLSFFFALAFALVELALAFVFALAFALVELAPAFPFATTFSASIHESSLPDHLLEKARLGSVVLGQRAQLISAGVPVGLALEVACTREASAPRCQPLQLLFRGVDDARTVCRLGVLQAVIAHHVLGAREPATGLGARDVVLGEMLLVPLPALEVLVADVAEKLAGWRLPAHPPRGQQPRAPSGLLLPLEAAIAAGTNRVVVAMSSVAIPVLGALAAASSRARSSSSPLLPLLAPTALRPRPVRCSLQRPLPLTPGRTAVALELLARCRRRRRGHRGHRHAALLRCRRQGQHRRLRRRRGRRSRRGEDRGQTRRGEGCRAWQRAVRAVRCGRSQTRGPLAPSEVL